MAQTSPIRVGIIGLGGAARQMVPAFVKNPETQVAAAADVDPGVLEAFKNDFNAEVYTEVDALLRNPNIDAVYIATPNHYHTPQTLAALAHGKHVILEKPMAITQEDAFKMVDAAAAHGKYLIINEPYSFTPALSKVRDIISSGDYGKFRMVHSWMYNDWLYRPRTADELNPELGGGVLYRQGPHQFDLLRMIGGGLVRQVNAMGGTWDPARRVPGSYAVYMGFQDGAVATAVYNGYDRLHTVDFSLRTGGGSPLKGDRAYARSRKQLKEAGGPEGEEAAKRTRRYGGNWSASGGRGSLEWLFTALTVISCDDCEILLCPDGLFLFDNEHEEQLTLPEGVTGRDSIVNQLCDAMLRDRAPGSDGRWGAATLEVSLAAIQSSERGEQVSLSHQVVAPK